MYLNRTIKYPSFLLALLFALNFSACYKIIPTEEPVLSEEKIQMVLKDIHVAEAILAETVNRREKDSLARLYYGQIFLIHKVTPEEIDQSMHAYFSSPPRIDSIYKNIMDKIAEEKKQFKKGTGPKPDPMQQERN